MQTPAGKFKPGTDPPNSAELCASNMPKSVQDLEKDYVRDADTTTFGDSSSSSGGESPRLQPLKETQSRHSRRSHGRSQHSEHSGHFTQDDGVDDDDLELEHEHDVRAPVSRTRSGTSIGSNVSRPPDFEVVFETDDPENPKNWPLWYRAWTIFSVSFSTWVVVLYSTSYTASIPGLMDEYQIENQPIVTLGVTTYLLGLAVGSLVVAPMSELYGRRVVYIICLILFTILILPCALATSMAEILVVRFFGALFGAAMVSNSPGTISDISDEEYRALCMSLWSIAPLNGPVTGPLIGGFVYEYLGWRWDNWLVLIIAGTTVIVMSTVKETYAPAILEAKAARIRKETGDDRWWCRYEQKAGKLELIKVNLMRPFILALTEPILWFFNIWISLIYGILYLCFVAYPIVFVQYRGWTAGISGLAFVGIGVGTMIAIVCEPLLRRLINSHPKDPETGRVKPEASASVMLLGAILTPIGQLVFSWTCLPVTIHWAIPIAFGIPFGCGNTMSFIYGANYLAGAYGIYAASALAGNAVVRSLFGGTLPLAGPNMYATLTPQWAGTLLGLLEVCMIPIPFVFYRYGERIRSKSKIIRQLREDQDKNEGRRAREIERLKNIEERRQRATADGVVENVAVEQSPNRDEAVAGRDLEKGASDPSRFPVGKKDETSV